MSFLKSKVIFFMALFLSLLAYGSHIPNSGIRLNEMVNPISVKEAPGGINNFIVDSYEEDGFVIFTVALPAIGVTEFNPDTDVTVINGSIDHHDFYDWGEDTVYYEFSMNSSSSNVSSITMSVSENVFFVNGIGNQVASLAHSIAGVTPTPPENTAPSISITSPSSGAEFIVGGNVTFSASASDNDGNIVRVDFHVGNSIITDTSAPYSVNWPSETGTHAVFAIAIDNDGASFQTAAFNIIVEAPIVAPGDDRAGLIALYNATGGSNWTNDFNWGTDESIGLWHGVTVNAAGRVTRLQLTANNLSGQIPEEIANLTELEDVNFWGNSITSLPDNFGSLVNLKNAIFFGSNITSLPASFGNLTNLESIDFWNNNITELPVNFGNLGNLKRIILRDNDLTELPASFVNLSNLEALYLNSNHLNFSDLETVLNTFSGAHIEYTPQLGNVNVANSQSVNEGGSITLSNPLTGANNSYQWFKDGVTLGITTKNLVISNATLANAGIYHFIAANSVVADLTLTSESITLTVNEGVVTPPPPPQPPIILPGLGTQNQNMAVNIDATVDYSIDKPWADEMRSHRSWSITGTNVGHENGGDAPRDINGWPTTDAECLVYHGLETGNNHGTYKLSFETNNTAGVSISVRESGVSFSGKSVSGNRVSYTMVISDLNNSSLYLDFTGTGNGVRNVKLMRPITTGSTESYPENTEFTTQFLTMVAPFSTIRFMDWTSTNSNDDDIWEERTKWTDASQSNPPVIAGKNYEWQGRGASWESIIKMSNTLGKDAWICVPHKATDGYIRELAKLFRDGNEFTSALNSNLNLYVEYSNEIWNDYDGFTQTQEVTNNALANVTEPYLNFDNILGEIPNFDGTIDPDDIDDEEYYVLGIITMREKAARSVRISEIFREEFGDSQMMNRIRPVLAFFRGQNDTNAPMVSYIDRYFNKRDSRSDVAIPHPVNYYLWGAGGSTYWYSITEEDGDQGITESDFNFSAESIWDLGEFNPEEYYKAIKNDMITARSYGLEYVAYEGNTHYTIVEVEVLDANGNPILDGAEGTPYLYEDGSPVLDDDGNPYLREEDEYVTETASDEDIIIEANILPQMKEEFKEHHQVFESLGGYLNSFFSTTGGSFALTLNNEDYTTPKFQAIYEMSNEEAQTITYKNEAPFTLDGGQFDFITSYTEAGAGSLSLISNNSDLEEAGNVSGYIFTVPNTGTYQLEVSYSGNGTSGLAIEFDGNLIETIVSATTGTFTQSISCNANRLHSIRVVAIGTALDGTVTINTVAVGSVTAQNVVSNQFQNLLIPTQVSLIRESSNLLFPNPANVGDNVFIGDIEGNTVHVEILNMRNILIKEETVAVRNNTYTFNTSNLSSGIYIVKITNTEDNRTVTKRMVIGSGK